MKPAPFIFVAVIHDGRQLATTITCYDRRKLLDYVTKYWLRELLPSCKPLVQAWLEHEKPNAAHVTLYGHHNNLSVEISPARHLTT